MKTGARWSGPPGAPLVYTCSAHIPPVTVLPSVRADQRVSLSAGRNTHQPISRDRRVFVFALLLGTAAAAAGRHVFR